MTQDVEEKRDSQPPHLSEEQVPRGPGGRGAKGRSGPPGNQHALKHGHFVRDSAMKRRKIDRRSKAYRAIAKLVREYKQALGGSKVSPQVLFLLQDAATTKVMLLDPIDAYLSSLKSPVRKGKVNNAVAIRQKLARHIRETLSQVGLQRVDKRPKPAWD